MKNHPFLFVYGTLKRNFDNPYARLLKDYAHYIGEGFFTGELYLCDWYPAAIYNPTASSNVYGEIYRMLNPTLLLQQIDEYEELTPDKESSLYLRKLVPVTQPDNSLIECQVYLYNQSIQELIPIPDGIFTKKRDNLTP